VAMQQWQVPMVKAVTGLSGLRHSLLMLGKLLMQLTIWSRAHQAALELLLQQQTWQHLLLVRHEHCIVTFQL